MNRFVEHLVRITIALFGATWRVEVAGECHLNAARTSGRGLAVPSCVSPPGFAAMAMDFDPTHMDMSRRARGRSQLITRYSSFNILACEFGCTNVRIEKCISVA